MPKLKDVTVFRGDNAPNISWTMPFTTTSYSFTLTISWDWGTITETVSGGGLTNSTPTVTWLQSTTDTSQIPAGNYATYELRSELAGVYTTQYYGAMKGLGGLTVV